MSGTHEGAANQPGTTSGCSSKQEPEQNPPAGELQQQQQHEENGQEDCSLDFDVEQNDNIELGRKRYDKLGVIKTHFEFWNSKFVGASLLMLEELLTFLEGVPHMDPVIHNVRKQMAMDDKAALEEEAMMAKAEREGVAEMGAVEPDETDDETADSVETGATEADATETDDTETHDEAEMDDAAVVNPMHAAMLLAFSEDSESRCEFLKMMEAAKREKQLKREAAKAAKELREQKLEAAKREKQLKREAAKREKQLKREAAKQLREQKQESEREAAKQLRKQKQESDRKQKLRDEVNSKMYDIAIKAKNIETALLALSSLSQAEGTIVPNSTAANTRDVQQQNEAQRVADEIFEGEAVKSTAGSSSELYGGLLEPENKLVFSQLFKRESLHLLDSTKLLRQVSKVFEIGFQEKKFVSKEQSTGAAYKKTIQDSVEKLRSLFKSIIGKDIEQSNKSIQNTATDKKLIQDSVKELGSSLKSIKIGEDIKSKIMYPGPKSQEVGVHLVMDTLLEAIGDVSHLVYFKSQTANQSPPKSYISQEKVVLANEGRKGRRCDFSIWKRGRYMVVMFDGFMELMFEIKPGQRGSKSVMEMHNEARDQCLSHLSKSLLHCLRFADGAGVPSHATCVFGSLTHIEIIQLVLEKPGTGDACLKLLSTGPLPLVQEASFNFWFGQEKAVEEEKKKKGFDEEVEEMRKLLYASHPDDHGLDEDYVPLGIKALHALMMCPRNELFGPAWDEVSSDLGNLLGTGTFGMVFQSAPIHGAFAVKVSKSGLLHFIKREAAILKYLSSKKDQPPSVLSFVSSGLLKVTIGGIDLLLPALAVSPVGQVLYSIISQNPNDIYDITKIVMRDVGSALKFIHGENICHNDVNDSNIMLVPDEGKKWRAILIDFSIASPQYQKMTGFHGTAPFVHRDVHENYHWLPVAEYDKTSLGFALAVMLERGVVPWKGLNSKGSKIQTGEGASLYENRVGQATAALGAHKGLCGDAAARIKTLFELDKETFIPKACECSQNCGNKKCSCHQQGRSCSALCKCHEKCCNPNDCQNPNDCRNPFTSASSTPLKFDNNLFTDLVIFPKKNKSKSRLGPDV